MLVDHRAQLLVLHILHLGVRGRSSWAADRLAMGAAPEVCLCRPPSRRTSEGATWREQKVVDFPFCQISVLGKVDDLRQISVLEADLRGFASLGRVSSTPWSIRRDKGCHTHSLGPEMRATRVGVHFLTLSVLLSAAPVPDQTGSHVVGGARGPAPGKVGAAHSSLAGDAVGIDAVMQEIIDSKRFAPNRGRLPGGALEVVGSGAEHEDKHVDALRKFLGNREAKRPVLLSTPRVNHQMHAAGLASSFSRSNASTEYRTGAAIGETDWDGSKQIVVAAAGRGNISHVKEEGASTETDVCFAPPCPPPFASGFSIKPSRGVNNNLQESTAIVTIRFALPMPMLPA